MNGCPVILDSRESAVFLLNTSNARPQQGKLPIYLHVNSDQNLMRIQKIKTIRSQPDISPGPLTIVLGANDSGKSTFVRELYSKFSGFQINPTYVWRWIDDINLEIDDLDACLSTIRGSLTRHGEVSEKKFIFIDFRNIHGQPAGGKEAIIPEEEIKKLDGIDSESLGRLIKFRYPFVVYANCENRLSVTSPTGVTGINAPATDILNGFFRYDSLFDVLKGHIFERFQYHLVMLDHEKTKLELGTSWVPLPDESGFGDKVEYHREVEQWKKENFTPIQESGHGLRSMVRILEALLNEKAPVKLIDEPELHLYPGQKIWLGSMIAKLSAGRKSQTIVVTHDANILQGILDENPNVTILRFSKAESERKISSWSLDSMSRPPTDSFRADFLTGLFHDYSIAVEGESDRSFYNDMMSDADKLVELDVSFVPCRGEGGMLKVASLAANVNQRAAFILDMDVLFEKPSVVQRIVDIVFGKKSLESMDNLTAAVGLLRDSTPSAKWKELVGYNNRRGPDREFRLKHGQLLETVLTDLAGFGVFIVPRGDLESWAPEIEGKVRFPENAPIEIRKNSQLHEDISSFLNKIGNHLNLKATTSK